MLVSEDDSDHSNAAGLGMAESSFLGHFIGLESKDAECWQTFVNLFYMSLRRGHSSAQFCGALKRSILEGHEPPKSLAPLIGCLIAGHIDTLDLNTALAVETMYQKVSERFRLDLALKRSASKIVRNPEALSPETMQLLISLASTTEALLTECVKVLGWDQGALIIRKFIGLWHFMNENSHELPLESLCDLVTNNQDLLHFLSLYDSVAQVTLDQLLPAHDLLVKFEYPQDCLVSFAQILDRALSTDNPPPSFPIVNICSNAERILSSLDGPASLESKARRFLGVTRSINGLCRLPGREISKLLNTVIRCLSAVSIGPEELETISLLVDHSSQHHREIAKKLWFTACQPVLSNKLLIEKYLGLMETSSRPWTLLHPLLLSLSDTKLQFYQLYGKPALLTLARVVHDGEASKLQLIERGMAESIYMHLSALINVLAVGKPQYEVYARENYSSIARSMALILRYQVNMGWKPIERVANEYVPTASFYCSAPSRFPSLILTEMYHVWFECPNEAFLLALRKQRPDDLIGMQVILLFRDPLIDHPLLLPQLAEAILHLPLPRQQVIIRTISHVLTCLIESLQYQGEAVDAARRFVRTLSSVIWLCTPRLAHSVLQLPIAHINLHLLMEVANMSIVWSDQTLIDQFDAILFAMLRDGHIPEFPLFPHLSGEGAVWVLRRLTAVIFSECLPLRLDADNPDLLIIEKSMHLDHLLRGLIRSCSVSTFTIYVEELFSCCTDDCGVHVLAMCSYVITFALEFHMLPMSIITAMLQALGRPRGPDEALTVHEKLIAMCSNLDCCGPPLFSSLLGACLYQGHINEVLKLMEGSPDPTWKGMWKDGRGWGSTVAFLNHPLDDISLQ